MSCRKQRLVWILLGSVFFNSLSYGAVNITSVDFMGTKNPNEIKIQADSGPLSYEKQENSQDKQLVIELKGATISKSNSRKIDTSSFNSPVNLISPYQVEGQPDTVRVVIQLREAVTAEVVQEGNSLTVRIPNPSEGSSPSSVPVPTETAAATSPVTPNEPSNDGKSKLDEFVDNRSAKKFSGKPITLQIRDVDVGDVLRLISEASGFNIIIGDDVKGKLTLSLVEVPWDQALDVVLHTLKLGAERDHNILRVVTLQNLTTEKEEEFRAVKAAEVRTPRVTRVFPISYANLDDLKNILSKFGTRPEQGAAVGAAGGGAIGSGLGGGNSDVIVQSDNRTNSIIVRDLPDNIERMKKLIELLDTQTPQVMIEAKVVEASEGFTKVLSGSLGIGSGDGSVFSSFAGGNPIDPLVGSPGVFAAGSAVSANSAPSSGTIGLSPNVSFIPGLGRLNALLNWGETENQLKIVSSPKTVVLNKETANIVEGTPVLVPGTTAIAGVGSAVPNNTVQSANVSLTVKPTVTNDGSVLLDLTVSKDVPVALSGGNAGIGNRNMKTLVLVESGSTLVIGGIYTMQSTHTSEGFPFLHKLPIIGALFGSETEGTDRSELFFFVTPRILNSKEAGLNT